MNKKYLFPLGLLLVIVTFCFAADLTGKWTGKIDTPEGEVAITYNFSVEGESLKGTAEAMSQTMAIRNGKIKNDSLTFDVDYDGASVMHYGKITGDTIKMTLLLGDQVMEGSFVKRK